MKGFTLTLSMVIILLFMTVILTIETQKISIEEQTHSQHAKLRAINSILLDLNSSAFDYSLSRMGKRAMFNVINDEITKKNYVNNAKEEVCDEFKDNFENYITMSLGTRLNDTGLSVSINEIECEVELVDSFTVNLITSVNMNFTEPNKILITKKIEKNVNFTIEGLPDPLITIEAYNDKDNLVDGLVYRSILLSPLYEDSNENFDDDMNLIIDSDSLYYAKGWVYGELISYKKSDVNKQEYQKSVRSNILLINVNTQDELIEAINFAQSNGSKAIALDKNIEIKTTSLTNQNVGGCVINYTLESAMDSIPCIKCGTFSKITNIKKPSTCAVNFDCSHFTGLGLCKKEGNNLYFYNQAGPVQDYPIYAVGNSFNSGNFVLINEEKEHESFPLFSHAKAYNIERQRSATLCGNYFLNEEGPDIFSRMEGNLDAKDEFGIETFILGPWVVEDRSKVDHHYYNDNLITSLMIKGMLGCKDKGMCDSEILTIGRFTIFEDYLEKYGMEKIEYEG